MNDFVLMGSRTLLMYLAILIIFRVMGKREVGELSILDLVVFVMIGDLAVGAIENHDETSLNSILPMGFLMVIQIIFAYLSIKSKKFRSLVDGDPVIIINKGIIDESVMRKQRYNLDDLMAQLRGQGVFNVSDVEYAILETSGDLSILEKKEIKRKGLSPFPLIMDGVIQQKVLKEINKDEKWLRQELKKKGYHTEKRISLASYVDGTLFVDEK
ncbi:DUF421 domain-containing protein [Peribacillus sp. FSL H8-0477]|uniref:DUF421 domain-containing protein n=1 Tax=Peribacillus sp. FSL H8-0477 TaxID=2921388 RepID=UPI0030F78074